MRIGHEKGTTLRPLLSVPVSWTDRQTDTNTHTRVHTMTGESEVMCTESILHCR